MGYASDLQSIHETITSLGGDTETRHQLLKVDLADKNEVEQALEKADPDLIMHLAAESHVDRSISGPEVFIKSNVNKHTISYKQHEITTNLFKVKEKQTLDFTISALMKFSNHWDLRAVFRR